jgi:hypothetical protein
MDNGGVEIFMAHRVQHNNSRGPFKVAWRGRRWGWRWFWRGVGVAAGVPALWEMEGQAGNC